MRHGRPHRLRARLAAIGALVLAAFAIQFTLSSDLRLWPAWIAPPAPELVTPVDPVEPATAAAEDETDAPARDRRHSGPVRSLFSDATCVRWLRAPADVRRRLMRWVGWPSALLRRASAAAGRRCRAAPPVERRRLRPGSRRFQVEVLRAMVRRGEVPKAHSGSTWLRPRKPSRSRRSPEA